MSTKEFATAVVIGKFYPPHKGHHHLITTALSRSARVFVLVCHKEGQVIPGHLRARWLSLAHPEADVRLVDDTLGDDDTLAWARFTVDFLGQVPRAVFSSEAYGEPYARAMGSTHVMVDQARGQVPCSGTMIRENPHQHLEFLAPTTRAWFVPRICLAGAESTGKSTLAQALARYYGCSLMPEYAREYCEEKFGPAPKSGDSPQDTSRWDSSEFLLIARRHAEREDSLAAQGGSMMVVDTDAFATCLWEERYLGSKGQEVLELAGERRGLYALYLLCDTDIPWIQDGTRDGEMVREAMQARFAGELERTGRPWVRISGDPAQRLEASIQAIDKAVSTWSPFGLPCGIARPADTP